MSVQNIPQQGIPTHKGLGITPDYSQQVQHKALGNTQESSGDLAAWYEDAYAYYQAVQNGSEPMPDQTAWQKFLNQMNWAYQQLWGGGTGGTWDPMAGGGTPTGPSENSFGGVMGPNGEWVYTQKDVNIGVGEGDVHNIFGFRNNIYIASTAAKATLVKVTEGDPPQDIYKLVVVDEATGQEEVFYFENIEDIENITIHAANPNGVDIQVTDDRISVEEFDGVDLSSGSPNGMPEGATIEGDTAIHEGLHNEFYPPFGNISHHEVWGPADISVKGSDLVEITEKFDGTHIVKVTSRDGEVTTFTIMPGNPVNINCNPYQATFKRGPHGRGRQNGADGVPEGFNGVSLNGQSTPIEDNDVDGESEIELSEEVLDLLDYLEIDPSEAGIDQAFLNGLNSMPPSVDVLRWLIQKDPVLAQRLNAAKDDPDSPHKQRQVNERVAELLSHLYPQESISTDAESNLIGRFNEEEGEGLSERQESGLIFMGGTIFNIRVTSNGGFAFEEISDEKLDEMAGVKTEEEKDAEEVSDDEQAIAESLAGLSSIGYDADRIVEAARNAGIKLDKITFPPSNEVWGFLLNLDESFRSYTDSLKNVKNKREGKDKANIVRNHAIGLLQALFPNAYFEGSDTKKNHANDIKVSMNGGPTTGFNLFSDDVIKNGFNGNHPFNMRPW